MRSSERLIARMREELPDLNIPEGCSMRRTRAGWIQRQAGAWSWYLVTAEGHEVNPHIGSPETVADLLHAAEIGWHGHRGDYAEIGIVC